MEVIKDKCSCGEVVWVEVGAKICSRTDKKRPHYPDSELPEQLKDNPNYSKGNITVFVCRGCGSQIDKTVPSAKYE
ncbi:hypothetical protein N9878_01025 [bacterium]|nr:hypothetical protein [bacterium]